MTNGSKVELLEQISRTRRFEPDVCRSGSLARRFETHRRTVREALASAVPEPRKTAERASPVLESWRATIDRWLVATVTPANSGTRAGTLDLQS